VEIVARSEVVTTYLGNALPAVALIIACAFIGCAKVPSNQNLVANGDLTLGYGDQPASWTRGSDRYLEQGHGAEDFGWKHRPATHGELWLAAHEINIIDWEQTIALDPGIYHLSGEMWAGDSDSLRGSAVDLQFGDNALGLRGFDTKLPSGWRKGDLYFKLDKRRKVQITCKLMGRAERIRYASFRQIGLVRLSGPPSDGATVIDLDGNSVASVAQKVHSSRPFEAPEGDPWTLLLTLFLLVAVSVYGWVMLGLSSRGGARR